LPLLNEKQKEERRESFEGVVRRQMIEGEERGLRLGKKGGFES
jgi:hypothetical protein